MRAKVGKLKMAGLIFCSFFLTGCFLQAKITDRSSDSSLSDVVLPGSSLNGVVIQSLYNDEVTFSVTNMSSDQFTVTLSNGSKITASGSALTLESLSENTTYTATICLESSPNTCSSITFTTLWTLNLSDVYSGNGSWNSYVRNNGSTKYNATNVACDGTESGNYFNRLCLHGGELKKATASSLSGVSCTGISIADNLGVFDWTCEASTGAATAYSTGLKSTKGLTELVTESGYISNRIVLSQNSVRTHSTSVQNWWSNPVTPLPPGNAALSTTGTIYVLESSRTDSGHAITSDKIAVVVKRGARLSNGSSSITGTSRKYLWFEGDYGNSTIEAFSLNDLTFSKFNQFQISNVLTGGLGWGLLFTSTGAGARYLEFQTVTFKDSDYGMRFFTGGAGVYINIKTFYAKNMSDEVITFSDASSNVIIDDYHSIYSSKNLAGTVSDLTLKNSDFASANVFSQSTGLNLTSSKFYNLKVGTIGPYGMGSVSDTSFVKVLSTSALGEHPIRLDYSDTRLTFLNTSSVGGSYSLYNWRGSNLTFVNSVFPNGVSLFGVASGCTVAGQFAENIDFVNTYVGSFYNIGTCSRNIRFLDFALLGSTLTGFGCTVNVAAGPNTGLTNSTCANNGTSTATQRTGLSVSSTFVGAVTSDLTNTYDTNGQAPAAIVNSSTSEFQFFDNFFRGWNTVAANIVSSFACSAGNCQIWDYRFSASDLVLRNTTNDGNLQNSAFVAGTTCPTAVNGNRTITDKMTVANTFLINAVEIIDDSIGDDDGLCESNEACIYSPNYGAYQGEGDYIAAGTCTFQNGTVTGVQMYAYPTNGI